MNTIVIEHVAIEDLPAAWRKHLPPLQKAKLRVVIEEERDSQEPSNTTSAFGMWRDRQDLDDVANAVRQLREPRFARP